MAQWRSPVFLTFRQFHSSSSSQQNPNRPSSSPTQIFKILNPLPTLNLTQNLHKPQIKTQIHQLHNQIPHLQPKFTSNLPKIFKIPKTQFTPKLH
jgi:hypothetical protein